MRRTQRGVITPAIRRALEVAEKDAANWADARIPGAGHRHLQELPTYEQHVLGEKVERLKERVRAAR